MTEEVTICQLCGGEDIEKFSDTNWICRTCGLGSRGKPTESLKKHLDGVKKAVALAEVMFPDITEKQRSFRVQFHLHRTENHPENKHGYCEVCQESFSKFSAKEFKEKTGGYSKEHWFK